uniref:unspecific monooxygenase n=1 Tax=Heortia vitessoides TaxID=1557813 RepID=A0A411E5D9_9NEOP|nr:CYP6AB53 [Heortia vitessoides]
MFIILSIFVTLVFVLYWYGTRNFGYWKNKGIKHDPAYPFIGSNFKQLTFQVGLSDYFTDLYKRYPNERFVGVYLSTDKSLLLRDPRDVQHVLITDFHNFYLRGLKLHKDESDPFLKHLFIADGDLWKLLRVRMTPAFTTGKLKAMFPLIIERAQKLQVLAAEICNESDEVDVKDLLARYTTDFIGACGFGVDMDSLHDENSLFRKLGNRIFKITKTDIVKMLLKVFFPAIFKDLDAVSPDVKNMTTSLVDQIMKQRNYKPSERNDFIDLMLEIRQKGKMIGESIEKKNPDGTPMIVEEEFNDLLIAAQAFVFFAAGFETSSSTSSFTLHQLAFHPEAQEKCQKEIDEVLQKYENKLCYEAVKDMKYLTMAFKESMRIFPSVGVLLRKSASKYTFPDSDLTIDEGVGIIIPNHAMQMDEKYFDEPEKFIPERFSPENIHNIKNHVYLPFGEGPRACIGKIINVVI